MRDESDHQYFERRYAEENERATSASKLEVAKTHRMLAEQYRRKLGAERIEPLALVVEN